MIFLTFQKEKIEKRLDIRSEQNTNPKRYLSPDEVHKVCTDFAKTEQGSNPFGIDPSNGGSSQPSVRVADAFCRKVPNEVTG